MIDIIANIASILGFTMQMNDKFFAHGMNKERYSATGMGNV